MKQQVYVGFRKGTGLAAVVNRERLVSQYSHSAVRVGDGVIQASPFKGVFLSSLNDEYNKEFFWRPVSAKANNVLAKFMTIKGASYDWFGLLVFILPNRKNNLNYFYCHEFVSYVLDLPVQHRYTPETILAGLFLCRKGE
jgi:hypothetical protein